MATKELLMAERIAEAVEAAGGRAYFVGGYVRDTLMGGEGKDIDIEVHGLAPDKLKKILDSLGQRLDIGESFGIFGLRGYEIDIAMPRKEECRGRGHRDFDIFVDPHIGTMGAARRRDFTVNAMMQDVLTGEVIDHYGGRADLESGIIRHVDDDSFAEDPLRVLRGCQFAARFEFDIAEETVELCKKMDVSALPRERIMGETQKALLKARRPSIFFKKMREMEQLKVWFPELQALIGVPQNEKYHAEGDAWVHTMMVLDEAARLREYTANPLGFMLSALCHDYGKAVATEVVNGELHAYGHEIKGIPLAEGFMQRLTGETNLRKYVTNMTKNHMKPNMMAAQGASVKSTNRMLDGSVDPEGLLCLAIADGLGKISPRPYVSYNDFFRERLSVYREYMSRPQVTGKDLIDSGLKPDKSFSDYLTYAHKLHLAGVEKEAALKQTLAYAKKNALKRRKNMIKYDIEGGHLPVLICYPEMGETLVSESGAMSWMSENMKMSTTSGGGIKKMFGRLFSGESMFMNEYTPEYGSGMIAFSSCFPGSIMPYHVTPGNSIIVQKGGFLAMESQLELSTYIQKKMRAGLFGGEGFILQRVSGNGLVFIEIDGHCKEYELKAGESIIVDTGYLAAMTESCSMDVQTVKGAKNIFLGGEGLFHTRITGPGKVYLQSMPIMHMAEKLSPYVSSGSSSVSFNSNSDSGNE